MTRQRLLEGIALVAPVARAQTDGPDVPWYRTGARCSREWIRTADEAFYKQHSDWFAVDTKGEPYRAADKYITGVNSPYCEQYFPGVLTEIIERSNPEGVTTNGWSGLNRDSIWSCANCARQIRAAYNSAFRVRMRSCVADGRAEFRIPTVTDHEAVVLATETQHGRKL